MEKSKTNIIFLKVLREIKLVICFAFRFLKTHSEILTIPAAFAVWWLFSLYADSKEMHVYTAGIFQKIIFAVIAVLIFNGLSWVMLRVNFPYLKRFLDSDNEAKWLLIDEKTKLKYATIYFVLYFVSFVIVASLV